MENRPKYVCYWLGLSKIGVVAALINFNLRREPLAHCITASESKAMIFGGEMAEGKMVIFVVVGVGVDYFVCYFFFIIQYHFLYYFFLSCFTQWFLFLFVSSSSSCRSLFLFFLNPELVSDHIICPISNWFTGVNKM
jgi:hypothetical protein